MAVTILGIAGSLRKGSWNRRLLEAARWELPAGARLVVWEALGSVPPYNEDTDQDQAPASVARLRSAVRSADGLLIATPEYNHSLPGQLKNALDWLSRPWGDPPLKSKPCAVIGASLSAYGAVWAQAEARKVLTAIGARVIEVELPVAHASDAFSADGRLASSELRSQLTDILVELVEAARPASLPAEAVA